MDGFLEMMLAQAEGADPASNQEAGQQNQTAEDGSAPPKDETTGKQASPWTFWVPLILMLVVMYYFLFLKPKKRQQEQTQKLKEGLKRNARVQTIGGIIGTVVDVREDEVVIKIDETNNTKMRLSRRAISQVMAEEEAGKSK